MAKKIFKQIFRIMVFAICGALFGFISYGYLVALTEIGTSILIGIFIALSIVGAIVAFFIIRFTQSRLTIISPWERTTWLIGSLLAGLIFGWFFSSNAPIMRSSQVLEIFALGEKNQESQGSEIWLEKIMGPASIQASDLYHLCDRNENKSWVPDGIKLVSFEKQPAEIRCDFSTSSQVLGLRFGTHSWSGLVQVRFNQQKPIQEDLYSDNPGYKEVIFYEEASRSKQILQVGYRTATGVWIGLVLYWASVFTISMITRKTNKNSNESSVLLSIFPIHLLLWSITLGTGLLLLQGRYEWSNNPLYSRIGFYCSSYLFVIFTPILYYLIQILGGNKRAALISTAIWWVAATLPYSWLGLQRYFYSFEPYDFTQVEVPSGPEWFPAAFKSLPAIPDEGEIFLALTLAGLLITFLLYKKYRERRKILLLGFLAFIMILIQTWMHLSLRSPYSYGIHLEQPENPRWFISYMFPERMGAVNADLPVFRSLDLLFMGKPYWSDMMFRRSSYFYLISQVGYFINFYYIGLIFNIFLWFAAVVSGYLFTRKHWSERTAILTAGFIASGRLFIWYVGQPFIYLAEYASIMILSYLFELFVVEGKGNPGKVLLYAAVLGLFSLMYDLFPFYVFLLGYGILSKVNWKTMAAIITISLFIYGGLIFLYTSGLGMRISTENSQFMSTAIKGLLMLIRSGDLSQWYTITRSYLGLIVKNFIDIFFALPIILAFLGLFFLKNQKQTLIVVLFLLPAVLLQAVLQYGNSWIYSLPRFYYIAYPGVYILAAIFLDRCTQVFNRNKLYWLASSLPWLGLGAIVILNNLDVWGVRVF